MTILFQQICRLTPPAKPQEAIFNRIEKIAAAE